MLKIYKEGLWEFEAWSGGVHNWELIKRQDKLELLEELLEEIYPEGMTEMQLNDLLWFDDEWLNEMLDLGLEL